MLLSGVIRVAGRVSAADRRLLRILVGTTCLTSVVVVISAIHRMSLYQEAYGFSVQRLMVIAMELWLGAVFVLIALAGIGMSGRWLPRAVLVTGVLDADYLLDLSTDVEPALARLPQAMRDCARYRDRDRDAWYEFNLSRSRASHDGTASWEVCQQFWFTGS